MTHRTRTIWQTIWRTLAFALVALIVLPTAPASADPPDWIREAARRPASPIEKGADAVVLHDEVTVTVSNDGRIVSRRLYAVRILTKEGAAAAGVREIYRTDGGGVRSMKAWMLFDTRTREYGKDDTVDLALGNDVYNEVRGRVLEARDAAVPGAVFGAETETFERSVFTQREWRMQEIWPVRVVRRTLTLPEGWDVRTVTLNHGPVQPTVSGVSRTWELRDLPGLVPEPASPPLTALVPRIAVTYFPTNRTPEVDFSDWAAVSRWVGSLTDAQAASNPALVAKVKELTAGAKTDIDRIRAIARYVQAVHYISIQTGLGRGGGYKPHAAVEVFAKNYGDCKDKANLMRAMLATIGIRAHLVAIFAGDPNYVRPEWPSPQQFNHCIIAIVLENDVDMPAVLKDERLGRLLFFDPTDEYTPFGEVPLHEQGSFAMPITLAGAPLLRMPVTAPEQHISLRRVEASLGANGTLLASLSQTTAGDPASAARAAFKRMSRQQYIQMLEVDARRQVSGARISLSTVGDEAENNRFQLTLTLEAPGYVQPGPVMLVRPPQIIRSDLPAFNVAARRNPIVLSPRHEWDVFTLTLPAGFVVEEMPPARTLETSFGRLAAQWKMQDGHVVRELTVQMTRTTLAPNQYPELRRFLDAVREAERTAIVLVQR